jgi:hypothetical protein
MIDLAVSIISFVSAGCGAYFGSYLKKKGENRASQEDLHELVEQMKAVTEATKAIEANISSEVWDRKRQWEMKKEVAFETSRTFGSAEMALAVTSAAISGLLKNKESVYLSRKASEGIDECNEFIFKLRGLRIQNALVCGSPVVGAFIKADGLYMDAVLGLEINTFKKDEAEERINKFRSAMSEVNIAQRIDLGIPIE